MGYFSILIPYVTFKKNHNVGYQLNPKGSFTQAPSPKFHATRDQSAQSQALRAWKLGLLPLHTGSQFLSPKCDMVGVKQPVHWFLGIQGLGTQQGTSVWVGLSKSCDMDAYVITLFGGEAWGLCSKLGRAES